MTVNKIRITEVDELMALVDSDRNIAEGIDVSRLYINSTKEINWKCENGHTFKEKISVMYKRKHKCFYCTGRQIWPGENDLQTLYPEIAKEFDIEKNRITPDRISPKDIATYWWTCENNHPSFQQSVNHRVERKTVCPYCAGRKIICGENDLETLFPEIAKEWDTEKNNGVLPVEVSPYTSKSYWWICPKGHSYKKKVIQRTKYHKPIDCTKCIKAHSTSFPEQAIYFYAKKCFHDAINRYKDPFKNGMELDIYIPTYKLGIEYDGVAFHNDEDQHQREYKKYMACKQLGIRLVRIKESKDTWKDTADEIFYVSKRMKDMELAAFLRYLFGRLFFFSMYTFDTTDSKDSYLNRRYGFPTDFNVSRDRPEILEYLVDVEHSFGMEYPELAAMWCEGSNGKVTPFMFASGSNYQATWKCPKCGETWKSPIASIVSRKVSSCKACSMKEMGNNITKAKTAKNGSLAEKSEELLRQWDYEANGSLSPYAIPLNYSFEVAWKCDKCGYKWSSSPNARVRVNKISKCPHCEGRVAMPGVDDLETLYPEVAKSWDYERNGNLLPSQVRPYSNKKYYWICPVCGNSYAALPGNRIKGHVCRNCGNDKISKKKAKMVGQYDENGLLINTYQGAKKAAEAMQVTSKAIYQAIDRNNRSAGFYWKYIVDKVDEQ